MYAEQKVCEVSYSQTHRQMSQKRNIFTGEMY